MAAVPFPAPDDTLLTPPDAGEVAWLVRGVVSAASPPGGLTDLQRVLVDALFEAMTGVAVDAGAAEAVDADTFAQGLARRNEVFRTRILQVAILVALTLRPLPPEVAAQVEAFARALGVDDGMLAVARRFAEGSLGLAAFDFERNGYTATWSEGASADLQQALHTTTTLAGAWDQVPDDPVLAARWQSLEDLAPGTLGRRLADFYRARGFAYPGTPGSAPPLLAQHDWVHVIADYGTTVESELEVFAFIARANDDLRAFSLLAMVVSLFETGYLRTGAGLFEASAGHLSRQGMAERVADAMRRGALCPGSVDFLGTDFFAIADQPVEDVRAHFGVVPKGPAAHAAGSVGPWEPGGISPYQLAAGRKAAEVAGRAYDAFGASPAPG